MIFTDGLRPAPKERFIEDRPSSLGEGLGETFSQSVLGGSRELYGIGELGAAEGIKDKGPFDQATLEALSGSEHIDTKAVNDRLGPDIPIEQARQRVKDEGLEDTLKLPDDESIKEPALNIRINRAREAREYATTLARGPQGIIPDALHVGTSLGAGFLDPVNVGLSFIPVLGEARYAQLMARAGESLAARAAVRTLVGGVHGAAGMGAFAPLDYYARTQEGQDYTLGDFTRSILLGFGLGAGAHNVLGAPGVQGFIGDLWRGLPPRAIEDVARMGITDLAADRPVRGAEAFDIAAQSDPQIAEALASSRADPTRGDVYNDVYDKLIDAGMSEEGATHSAAAMAAQFSAFAERYYPDKSAMDLYREEGVDIRRGDYGTSPSGWRVDMESGAVSTGHSQLSLKAFPPRAHLFGEDVHSFAITDAHDNRVAEIDINASDPRHLHVEWIGTHDYESDNPYEGPELEGHGHPIGLREIRSLIPEIKRLYPYAETIGGDRVSGARTGPAADAGLSDEEANRVTQASLRIRPATHGEETLRSMIARGAPAKEIAEHPVVAAALRRDAAQKTTSSFHGYGSAEFKKARTFDFDGEKIKSYPAAIGRLIEQAKAYSSESPVSNNRFATLVVGLPGAGKSTFAEGLARWRRAALVDADDAKRVIPQYRGGLGATAVHDESRALLYEPGGVLSHLVKDGANIVLPVVGGGDLRTVVQTMKSRGYTVDLLHVDADPDEAYRRVITRYLRDGRIISYDYFKANVGKIGKNYDMLKRGGLLNEQATLDANGPRGEVKFTDGEDTTLAAVVRSRSQGLGGDRGDVSAGAGAQQFFQLNQAPTFYSAISRTVDNLKQNKASPEQWLNTIKNATGVKAEEMEWLGLNDWLKQQKGSVTKEQVQDYIRANAIEVKEVGHAENAKTMDQIAKDLGYGGWTSSLTEEQKAEVNRAYDAQGFRAGSTKFKQYTLPGGENYRELLLTLPQKEGKAISGRYEARRDGTGEWNVFDRETDQPMVMGTMQHDQAWAESYARNLNSEPPPPSFRSSHWDEPNILAHIRFNDRTINGKRTLFIEEIQSDWHQKGKKSGYVTPEGRSERERLTKEHDGLHRQLMSMDVNSEAYATERARFDEISKKIREIGFSDIPDAPFKTTWPELSLKRMLRYAAENGYDKLAWTPGEVQADRYDLSKQIRELNVVRHANNQGPWPSGTYHLTAKDINGRDVAIAGSATEKELANIIGKELAEKIVGNKDNVQKYSGLDLKVGGEGMLGFYDDILPAAANKLVKKYGARVGEETLEHPGKLRFEVQQAPSGLGPRRWIIFDRQANDYVRGTLGLRDLSFKSADEARDYVSKKLDLPQNTPVHSLDITPDLRKAAIEQGFPLFQGRRGDESAPRGHILMGENRALIELFKSADRSTFLHESAHLWLGMLARRARDESAPEALQKELGSVLRWLGVDKAEDISVAEHERFAGAFERYLAEGIAPSPSLAGAFEKFKAWLLQIYRSLRDVGVPINDEIRGVFDRMLASDREIEQARKLRDSGTPEDRWQAMAEASEPYEDPEIAQASRDASALPEQADAKRELSELEKAAADAEAQWKEQMAYLSEAEQKKYGGLLDQLNEDSKARLDLLRKGAACLAAAAGGI